MKPIHLFMTLLLATAGPVHAQDTTFIHYADQQSNSFVDAYNHRDIPQYKKLLQEFLTRYDTLSAQNKKQYSGYYTNAYYNLACTYAILKDKPNALAALKKAIDSGYTNYSHTMVDEDLTSIRGEAGFQQMMAPLKEVYDYRYILGKAGRYNNQDTRPLPAFTYLPATDPHLTDLRKGLNLDSIAGSGSDINRILNLLHWIHNLIPHDGNHNNPAVMNAMSLVATCKKDNRGLNCRGLATVLNECYLSLGYKSRFVTCLPKDSLHIDFDCHVINIVFIPSLHKWIWIDPTNDAYVMNEKGELLGIEEVRQRIIKNQPLILNPDANWNHKAPVTKEEYLYNYMAKNLYMLECPINSGYDLETRAPGKTYAYIKLIPLDYFKQGPDKEEDSWGTKGQFIDYHTNNAAQFWKTPN